MRLTAVAPAVFACLSVSSVFAPVRADIVVDSEAGNSRATATTISASSFTTPQPGTTFPFGPTATLQGSLTNTIVPVDFGGEIFNIIQLDLDFYRFSGIAGQQILIDVDQAGMDSPVFDLSLSLFSSDGTLLAFSDDTPVDSGSVETFGVSRDPFIGAYTLLTSGDYYLAVSSASNRPSALFSDSALTFDLTRPDSEFGGQAITDAAPGDDSYGAGEFNNEDTQGGYQVFVSLSAANTANTAAPEPGTLLLLIAPAAAGLLAARRQRGLRGR